MIIQDSPISLQATRGARKPNLQVTVNHARQTYVAVWTYTKNEWNA